MYGLCPACGSELDDEGNCWVCGYMAHFGSPDDYDYDDFNDEYLPQGSFIQVILCLFVRFAVIHWIVMVVAGTVDIG